MSIVMRTGRLAAAAAFLLLTAASRPSATTITLSSLRLNSTGLILVDVTLTQLPPPTGGVVDIEFSYVDGGSTITETVRGTTGAYNTKKAISSRQPFPCNKTLEVTATLKSPGHSPVYTRSSLSRRCTLSQGTPDLTVAKVERVDGGGLQSPREKVIRVRVTLANIGSNMPFNEQGGTPWTVQLTPGASGGNDGGTGGVQVFRIALSANQRITMDVMPVALQCGRLNPVTIVIDRDGVIREANENNNRLTVDIPGNRCQDA
jgi:hypothetical protein